jgi:hypothetical protein
MGYKPELVPSADEIWSWMVAMNDLGPNRYTGNKAHVAYINFLEKNLKSFGLTVDRDTYKFPRWEAKNWGITVKPAMGAAWKVPVSSYYPYSGQTGNDGVTGEVVHMEYKPPSGGGRAQTENFQVPVDVKGKIVYVDAVISPQTFFPSDRVWNYYTSATELVPDISVLYGRGSAPSLEALKNAGALGLVVGWTNISDEQAAYQYAPFGRALQGFPALWVGQTSAAKLKALSVTGAQATLVLEADIFQDSPTDTLIGTLPGMSDEEIVIVNSHTDGPNATEENGGIGILAIAKYFSKLPKSELKRTLIFPLTTGHFAHAYVPSISGFVKQHPDLVKKAVASITVEHLGCHEWLDDAAGRYADTGRAEVSFGFTGNEAIAKVLLNGVTGTADKRVAICKGIGGGEGGALMAAGVPTIGYLAVPSYLLSGSPDGCMHKLDRELMHGQIQSFARVVHQMQTMSAADLREGPWGNIRGNNG